MDDKRLVKVSKYLSRHLRHDPERLGLRMRAGGWVAVDELLAALAHRGFALTLDELDEVVRRNDKQRFGFDDTGSLIRARQGHTVPVDLELAAADPPEVLFHGTGTTSVAAILASGLEPRGRHHVHLSTDAETARRVGARNGRPAVLRVDAAAMMQEGFRFFRSDNGVWLVDGVPPSFLTVVE